MKKSIFITVILVFLLNGCIINPTDAQRTVKINAKILSINNIPVGYVNGRFDMIFPFADGSLKGEYTNKWVVGIKFEMFDNVVLTDVYMLNSEVNYIVNNEFIPITIYFGVRPNVDLYFNHRILEEVDGRFSRNDALWLLWSRWLRSQY